MTAQQLMARTLGRPGTNITTELRSQHADDPWRNFEVIANNLLADGNVGGVVLTYLDITEHKKFEHELTHLTFHDPLCPPQLSPCSRRQAAQSMR